MPVRHHEITIILILHPYIIAEGSKIVAQVQKTCGPDATHNYFLLLCHRAAKINKGYLLHTGILEGNRLKTSLYLGMEVNDALVDKLAHLSRLKFNASEKEDIKQDLQRMIAFVEKLNELDLDGVEPLLHMSDEVNVLREDVIKGSVEREQGLMNAPAHDETFF